MSSNWHYSPPPPASYWQTKKPKKQKMNSRSTTSFLLPKIDDMVLLKPIATPCVERDDFKDSWPATEKTRATSISDQLDRYNRWLAYADSSSSGKDVRSAAMDLQQTVRDINATISEMMIQIDRKILDLQDRTDSFVEAVQEGDMWRSNGDLLDLSPEELEVALSKDPQRNTEAQLLRLKQVIKKEAEPKDIWHSPMRKRSGRLATKLIRLLKEVQTCPGGNYEALHLGIFVRAHIFHLWDVSEPFGDIGSDMDNRAVDSLLLKIVSESRRTTDGLVRRPHPKRQFFDFALARRTMWNSIPAHCSICNTRVSNQNWPDPKFIDPFNPCRKANALTLIERLQMEAYGEIKSGIMLTLSSKLPKELCLLIFEFAMEAEEVPIEPTIFERSEQTADGEGINSFDWIAKTKYRCLQDRKDGPSRSQDDAQ